MSEILNFLDKIYYINLDHREDRKKLIIEEIKKIDPNLEKTVRFSAVNHPRGFIGCAESHLQILEECIEKDYKNVLVLEDDFVFRDDNSLERLDILIKCDENFNLLLLGRNLLRHRENDVTRKNEILLEVMDAQTTSGYLMSGRIFRPLQEIWSKSLKKLKENPGKQSSLSCDITWKRLQGPGKKVYTTNPSIGLQRASYSDIEKKHLFYGC